MSQNFPHPQPRTPNPGLRDVFPAFKYSQTPPSVS